MSEFEKKIIEFKEKIKIAKNLSELTKINSEIFDIQRLCLNKDFGVIIISGFLNSLCICLLST